MTDQLPVLNTASPKKAILSMRIIWAALLMGQLMFLGVIASGAIPTQHLGEPNPLLVQVNLIMFATVVPVAFLIRSLIFRRSRNEQFLLPPGAYATGNIIFWAGCEGVSFFGLVIAMLSGSLWPTIMIVAAAMGLQAITFPVSSRLDMSETSEKP